MTEMVPIVAQTLFWGSLAVVAFTYAGYPLALGCASTLFGRRRTPPDAAETDLPSVSLAIVAHNEEKVIGGRLANALALEYPAGRLEIVVASDGSSDRTETIVDSYAARGVRLVAYPERRGKAAVLNDVMREVSGDVVVLSDANTLTTPDAVRKLARWFVDPSVGVVCGRLRLVDRANGTNVDALYWKLEMALKEREARLGAIIGANGAIYAIRQSMYAPIRGDTIIDDLVVPLKARLTNACRVVFDADALAIEETAPHMRMEFRRRVRIGAGGFQAITELWRLLHPRHGWIAVTFFCHKVLRWCCPLFFVLIFVVNLPLASQPFFALTMAAQVTWYLAAAILLRVPLCARLPRPVRLVLMFPSMNLALLVGLWRWLRGTQSAAWTPTCRDPAPPVGVAGDRSPASPRQCSTP